MAVNSDAAAAELGAELRNLRDVAGWTTRQLANAVDVSNANVSFWETGKRLIPMDKLTAVLDALEVEGDDRERLLGLRRRAEGPGELTAGVPGIGPQLHQLIEYEQIATRIVDYAPLTLPGLLQTTGYARAVLSRGPAVDTRVALRAGRRDVLTRRIQPVELLALIDTEALVRPIAPADVMRDQYEHLLAMGKRDNITIRLVPSTVPGWHPGLVGPFIYFEFARSRPVVHAEHYRASAWLWEPAHVADYLDAIREIEEKAMTPARTAEVIEKLSHGMEPG
jgi:transcriptional regulator with XRE-family HTH domain